PQMDVEAVELQRLVHEQDAGQEARFAEDLKAVAHAEDRRSGGGARLHLAHDRRARGDRAAPQIVAVGVAARNDDEVDLGQLGVGVPDAQRLLAGGALQRVQHVGIAVRAGEGDDGGLHGAGIPRIGPPIKRPRCSPAASTCALSRQDVWPAFPQGGSAGEPARRHNSDSVRQESLPRSSGRRCTRTSRYGHPASRAADPDRSIRSWDEARASGPSMARARCGCNPRYLRRELDRRAVLRPAVFRPAVFRTALLRAVLLRTADLRDAVLRVAAFFATLRPVLRALAFLAVLAVFVALRALAVFAVLRALAFLAVFAVFVALRAVAFLAVFAVFAALRAAAFLAIFAALRAVAALRRAGAALRARA